MSMRFTDTRTSPTTGMFRSRPRVEFAYGKRTVGISTKQIKDITDNLTILGEYLTLSGIHVVAAIVVNLLQHALPRTPYDTGQLRESGRAYILTDSGYYDVGRGSKDGTVSTRYGKVKRGSVNRVSGVVQFSRSGERGTDVAVWTHEDLLPYDMRPQKPAARKPGTGPKYLEHPWMENKGTYIDWIQDVFSHAEIAKDIKAATRTLGTQAKEKYMVDRVKLDEAKLYSRSRRILNRGKR